MTNPYENLANAIILQAVKDYRDACRKQTANQDDPMTEYTKCECEEFFLSQWYELLADVDGEYLLRKLQEEVAVG